MPQNGFSTRQVHAGTRAPQASPRTVPVHLTAGFTFASFDDAAAHFGEGDGFGYTRTGNPSVSVVEEKLAELEGGTDALLLASGQAATAVALLGLVGAGSHVVSSTHIYEGTRGLLQDNLARFGVEVDFVTDIHDPDAWRRLIRPETSVFFGESIANARNDILDIALVAEIAHEHGIPLVVDNTLATPYLVRPIEHGADVVVHSASKFLAGQGAVLGGVIVDAGTFDPAVAGERFAHLVDGEGSFFARHGGRARAAYLRDSVAPRFGTTPSPWNAFLIGQGIETLSLRIERQSANARTLATWLASRPEVTGVDYVGLESHPDHAVGARYLQGGSGSIFTVTLAGGEAAARAVIESVRVITHMTHIGDVRTLILHPGTTSHVNRTEQERQALGVFPGTVRISVGIEDVDDLIADLTQAFAAIEGGAG